MRTYYLVGYINKYKGGIITGDEENKEFHPEVVENLVLTAEVGKLTRLAGDLFVRRLVCKY